MFLAEGKFVQGFPLGNYNGFSIDKRSNIGKRSPEILRPLGNQIVPNGASASGRPGSLWHIRVFAKEESINPS